MGLKHSQLQTHNLTDDRFLQPHPTGGDQETKIPNTVPIRRILMSPRMWLPFSRSRSTPPKSKQRIAFLT